MTTPRSYQQSHTQSQDSYFEESSYDQKQSSEIIPPKHQSIDEQVKRIREELKTVPYQLILKQRSTLKEPNKPTTPLSKTPKIPKDKKKQPKTKQIHKQKKQKNQALQVNIHKHNRKKFKPIFQSSKGKSIDPRFQTYAGHYNQDLAMKSYNFIPELQKQEINQLRNRLKKNKKRNKISQRQRQIMLKEYNNVTSAFKRGQLVNVQKQTKKQLKMRHGNNFHISKNIFKQQFQKKKFQGLSQSKKQKKIKEKQIQIRRQQLGEKRNTMHMKIK